MRNPVEIGELVYLRPIELDDIDGGWLSWVNDKRVSEQLTSVFPMTREDLARYYEDSKPPGAAMFAVCTVEDDTYIGNARLSSIDWRHRKCTYGRLIGATEYRGKGHGTEALRLLLRYAFIRLGMNRVHTVVFAGNEASVRSNEKAGMKKEGVLRQALYHGGRYVDVVKFAMLRPEFDELYSQ